jgi:hypothetical protein
LAASVSPAEKTSEDTEGAKGRVDREELAPSQEESGWLHVQREAGVDPESDEGVALVRVKKAFGAEVMDR